MTRRFGNWAAWGMVCALALAVLPLLARNILAIPAHVPLDPNEGWNAAHALAAMAGRALYPPPASLMVNNYPPLSFYIVGALARLTGDAVVAGRIVSLLSFLACAGGLALVLRHMACGVRGQLLAILFFAATLLIARHLTRVLEENKRTEAELRSIGTHLRESGEGTALADGKKDGRHTIGAALKAVIAIWRIYCWQLMRLTLITYTSLLITPIVGLLLCTPKYLQGMMTLGEVVQAAAAFVVVQGAFSWFTDNYARLAEWAASANRVASLLLALDRIGDERTTADLLPPGLGNVRSPT